MSDRAAEPLSERADEERVDAGTVYAALEIHGDPEAEEAFTRLLARSQRTREAEEALQEVADILGAGYRKLNHPQPAPAEQREGVEDGAVAKFVKAAYWDRAQLPNHLMRLVRPAFFALERPAPTPEEKD